MPTNNKQIFERHSEALQRTPAAHRHSRRWPAIAPGSGVRHGETLRPIFLSRCAYFVLLA